MASTIDPDLPLGALVTGRPGRTLVLEAYHLDYCCGGSRSLREACHEAGASLDEVVAALAADDERNAGDHAPSWSEMGIGALAGHILDVHHTYYKRAMPRLAEMADKVVNAHGEHHPELIEVRDVLTRLREELDEHMGKEERALFPWCQQIAAAVRIEDIGVAGVDGPINCMLREHDDAGIALETVRSLTRDYSPPADACPTLIAYLDGLRELEEDLHLHIHKENNLLFGKVLEREKQLADAAEAGSMEI